MLESWPDLCWNNVAWVVSWCVFPFTLHGGLECFGSLISLLLVLVKAEQSSMERIFPGSHCCTSRSLSSTVGIIFWNHVLYTFGSKTRRETLKSKSDGWKEKIISKSRYSKSKQCIAVGELHHTATGNYMSCGITQCHLSPGSGDFPAFTPAEGCTRFSDPEGMQGCVDLGGGYNSRDSLPAKDGHLPQK